MQRLQGTQSETLATTREPTTLSHSQLLTSLSSGSFIEEDYEILTTQGLETSQRPDSTSPASHATENSNAINMSDSLQVKAVMRREGEVEGSSPEIRRFTVNGVTYEALLDRVRTVFNTEKLHHSLFWKDDDDDLVQFSTTEELCHALNHLTDNTLRIYITVIPHHVREESMATDSLYPNLEGEDSTPICKEAMSEEPQGTKPTRRVTFQTPLYSSRPHGPPGPYGHPHLHFSPWQWKAGRCRPFMGPGRHWAPKRKMPKKMMCMKMMMANSQNKEFNVVRQQVPEEFRSWVRQYVRTWFLQSPEIANEIDTLPAAAPRHFKSWLNDFLSHWKQKKAASAPAGEMGMEDDVEEGVEAEEDSTGEMLSPPEGLPPMYYQWLCLFLPRFYQNQIKNKGSSMDGNEGYGQQCPAGPWRFHGHRKGYHHGKHGCHGGKKAWKKRGWQSSSESESENSDGGEKTWKNVPKEFRKYVRVSAKKMHKNKEDSPKVKEKAVRAGVTPEVVEFVQQILLEWHAKLSQKRPRVVAKEMMEAERILPSGMTREHFLWMCRFMARWHRRHAGKCDLMSGWSSGETDEDTTSGEDSEEGCVGWPYADRRYFKPMKRFMKHWHHHPHGMMGPMGHPAPPPMHPGMGPCFYPPPPPPPPFGCGPPPPRYQHFNAAGGMFGPGFRMSCGVSSPDHNAHGCGGPNSQAKSSQDEMVDQVTESMKKI